MTETITAEEYNAMQTEQTQRKYRNEPCEEDGYQFDSKKERARYRELKQMRDAGLITNLALQPPFDLTVNGVKIGKYVADFSYFDNGLQADVIEDVKGMKTPTYRIKKKLMKAIHGIEIVEVMR